MESSVLLICFLWYIARQDTMAERQFVSGMMQALMQQQTATLSVLRDVAVKGSGQADIQNAAGRTTTASTPDHKP